MLSLIRLVFVALILNSYVKFYAGEDGLELCQSNCVSPDRLIGPTRPPDTRTHPWKIAAFPSTTTSFCKLGCQFFFSVYPTNTSCLDNCDVSYRYKVTTGYSDTIEEARLECRDGCNIAMEVCQAGYYCDEGRMLQCPAGTYREGIANVSMVALEGTHKCTECPFGRYRSLTKGKSADECTKCPAGKYANVTGGINDTHCLRCPAGKFAAEEGSQLCKCITDDSCDLNIDVGETIENFYKNDVDYYRETVPFIGRW